MKKVLALTFLTLFLVASIAMVSAETSVVGKVYNADYTLKINDATVDVICTHNTIPTTSSTTSFGDGDYIVKFTNEQCGFNDTISVHGFKAGVGEGIGDGNLINVDLHPNYDVALGVSNIALIPEFGVFVGALTLLSALGVFFVVRRK